MDLPNARSGHGPFVVHAKGCVPGPVRGRKIGLGLVATVRRPVWLAPQRHRVRCVSLYMHRQAGEISVSHDRRDDAMAFDVCPATGVYSKLE